MALPAGSLHKSNLLDMLLSASMVAVAIIFAVFVFVQTGTGHLTSYALTVRLTDAGGLARGADVRLNGITVGRVTTLSLQGKPYQALIRFQLRDDLVLPVDSTPSVASSVMGTVYLDIKPGHDHHTIPPGGAMRSTGSRPPALQHAQDSKLSSD